MKTVVIVQARMTSTRLPGKVLKPVLGKPLLEYQLERLKRIRSADTIVIATTTNETDQPIVELCERLGIPCYRGPEDDVLARYYGAAVEQKAEVVVRVTSDCPVIDPDICDQVIRHYVKNRYTVDYVRMEGFPRGLDTEVFSFQTLEKSFHGAKKRPEREHVTPYIYRHPELFQVEYFNSPEDRSYHRWTVDTPEDFELVRRIITELYPQYSEFGYRDILTLLEEHPAWVFINAEVKQKKYGE
jgi:spore coat polysaccharide biosynthesis protein SpsF